MCIVYLVDDVGGCLGGVIVSTWLATILWNFSSMDLVLYLCTSGTLHAIPLYGCSRSGRTSVSSRMTWGSVWVG